MYGAADLIVGKDSSMSFLFSIGYDESNDGYHLIEPWNVDCSMDKHLGQDDVRTSLNSLLIFSGLYRFLFVRKLVTGLRSILHYSRSISESLLLKLPNSHYWSTWECAHHNINRKSTMHSASFWHQILELNHNAETLARFAQTHTRIKGCHGWRLLWNYSMQPEL
jgi:hypothetical protein